MKIFHSTRSTFLLALLAISSIRSAQAQWWGGIVNTLASPLTAPIGEVVDGICDDAVEFLFNNSAVECECDGSLSVTNGLEVNLHCGFQDGVCLFDGVFCGFPTVEAIISLSGFKKFETCLSFENDPLLPIDTPEPFCFTGHGSGWLFDLDRCEMIMDTDSCECTVCDDDDGGGFTYDCSMNTFETPNLEILDDLPGPKMPLCVSVGNIGGIWGYILSDKTPSDSPSSAPSDQPSSVPSTSPSSVPSASPSASFSPAYQIEEKKQGFWSFLPWN